MKKWQKIGLGVAGGILLIALAGLMAVSSSQAHRLITQPMAERNLSDQTPGDYNLPYEDVTVTAADGLRLVGWYIPSQNGAVIIAQPGYKANRDEMLNEAEMLYRHGYGVLIDSVRAHDRSDGELISFGYREMQDLEAWYRYVLTRPDARPDRIGLLGNSMGGSLIIQYASSTPPRTRRSKPWRPTAPSRPLTIRSRPA